MKKIRVLLARTPELWWDGLLKLLNEQEQIEIVGICNNELDTIDKAKLLKPDIVLIDEEILSNVNVVKDINRIMSEICLQTNIIIVMKPYKNIDVVSIFKMRARAYIDKDITMFELIDTLEKVAKGDMIVISPLVAAQLLKYLGQIAEQSAPVRKEFDINLSRREIEILTLLAIKGTTNKEIADELFISENTVKSHIANIMWKMNVRNRQQAAALAIKNGMIIDTRSSIQHGDNGH